MKRASVGAVLALLALATLGGDALAGGVAGPILCFNGGRDLNEGSGQFARALSFVVQADCTLKGVSATRPSVPAAGPARVADPALCHVSLTFSSAEHSQTGSGTFVVGPDCTLREVRLPGSPGGAPAGTFAPRIQTAP